MSEFPEDPREDPFEAFSFSVDTSDPFEMFGRNVQLTTQETVTEQPEQTTDYFGGMGFTDEVVTDDVTVDTEVEEWEPIYSSDYYESLPMMNQERAAYEQWKLKPDREALPEEIEEAKTGVSEVKPLTIKDQLGLNFNVPLEKTQIQRQEDFIEGLRDATTNKIFVTPKETGVEVDELTLKYGDIFTERSPEKHPHDAFEQVGDWIGNTIMTLLDVPRTLAGQEAAADYSWFGYDPKELTVSDKQLIQGAAQTDADLINKELNQINSPIRYQWNNGKLQPYIDYDSKEITKNDVLKAFEIVKEKQKKADEGRLTNDELSVIKFENQYQEALKTGTPTEIKEAKNKWIEEWKKLGGVKRIFSEDGSFISKKDATPADEKANSNLDDEASQQWGLSDEQSMLNAKRALANKLIYLSKEISKDPKVIGRGMNWLDAMREGGFGSTFDISGYLEKDNYIALEDNLKIINQVGNEGIILPELKYLPGGSILTNQFNNLLKQYNVVTRAMQLNMDPTTNIGSGFVEDIKGFGAQIAEKFSPTDVETARELGREFVSFTQDEVGISITQDLANKVDFAWDTETERYVLDKDISEQTLETIVEIGQVMAEFAVARKVIGKKNIKKLGNFVRESAAGKPRIIRAAATVSASIIEEAAAIQARNVLIAPITGGEDMSLTWAVGAGAMGSVAKYFSPAGVTSIWTTGNKTVNRLITAIGGSQTANLLAKQLIQPAIGTGVMIAGEITENILTTDKGMREIWEEASDWDKLASTWATLFALQNSKAPLNIVREPYRAVEADILALGKKTRFTQKAAKALGLESNYMDKNEKGDYILTEDKINKQFKEKRKEVIDSELSKDEKFEKLRELTAARRSMIEHRQYLDIKNTIKATEGGKQIWADQYVESMNLAYGRELTAENIEGLANTPSTQLTRLLVRDPNNKLSKPDQSALANRIMAYRELAADLSMEANLTVASQGGLRGKARINYFKERLKQLNAERDLLNATEALKDKKITQSIYDEQISGLEKTIEDSNKKIESITDTYTKELKESKKFEKISKPLIERAKEAGFKIIEDKTLEGEAEIGGGVFRYNPKKAPEFFTLGVHEVGHPVVNRMLKGKTQAEKDSFVEEFKKILPEKTYRLIEERLLGRQNVKDYKENPNTVEWMNVFLDITGSGALKYEGNFFGKVKDFLNKYKKGKDYSLDLNFENPKEVYENLKAFAEAAGKGKAGVGEKGEMLVEALKKAPQMEGTQKSVTIDLENKKNQDTLNEQVGERTEEGYYTMPKKEWLGSRAHKIAKNLIDGGSFDLLIGKKIFPGKKIYTETRENILEDSRAELKRHLENFDPTLNKNLFGYLNSYVGAKVGTVTGRAKKTVPTVSRDIQVEGRKMPEPESKDLDPSELADIVLAKERKAKAEKDKPKETVASKVGMPKVIVDKIKGETSSEEYIEEAAEKVDYRKLPEISTPPGPNQTIPPFLSKLKAQIATSRKYKEEVAQSMGTRKDYIDYLDKNFEKIVKNLPPSYFSGLIERKITSGVKKGLTLKQAIDAVILPKNMIQKDIGQGYTSNWQGKKTVGTKAAKTGITSGLKRIRLNPNFDFKNKANIEAFKKAFKSQGRKEGLAGQISAKGVVDYLQKNLGTESKIDKQLKDSYDLKGRELPKDYAKQFREQVAKSEVQRSATEEKIEQEKLKEIANARLLKEIEKGYFLGDMKGMANAIKSLVKENPGLNLIIPKEISKEGIVRDPEGQEMLINFTTNILPRYYGKNVLLSSVWAGTASGKGMWMDTRTLAEVRKLFLSHEDRVSQEIQETINPGMASSGLDVMKTSPFTSNGSKKKFIDKVNKSYKGLDLFIDQSFKMLKENPDQLSGFLAMMKNASVTSSHFWRNFSQVIGKHVNWADKVMMDPKKKGKGVGEHALVQNQAGEFMTKAILESIAKKNRNILNTAKELLSENYFQILISHGSDNKLTEIGLQSSMPKGFWESWNKALETGNVKEAWSVWSRYFNKEINKIKGADGELGFNPNNIMLLNRKTGEIESLADTLGIGEKHFGKDVLNPEIIAKQQELIGEWSRRNPNYNTITKLREHLAIDLDMLNAKRNATLNSKKELEKIDNIFKVSEKAPNEILVQKSNTFDKALAEGRKLKKEIKKARVFDFDDTIAKSKSKVLYETIDGEKGKLTPEEFAARGEELKEKGVTFDFSEFNKVVEGKKGPLFELFKRMKEAAGDRDMFILTARSGAAAPAIKEFLNRMGVEIPLDHITGLGDSSPLAKSDWVVGKAAEGYNDFYFADDHLPNVEAVKKALSPLEVKAKVQQAKDAVQFEIDKLPGESGTQFSMTTKRDLDWKESTKITDEGRAMSSMKAKFEVKGVPYEIYLDLLSDKKRGSWDLGFTNLKDGKRSQAITGDGNASQVLSIVSNAVFDLAKRKDVNVLNFSSKEKSRTRLYKTLTNLWADKLGWNQSFNSQHNIFHIGKPGFEIGLKYKKTPQETTVEIEKSKDKFSKQSKPVKKVLNVIDIKGKVQQAIMQKSNTLNEGFNKIIEESAGVDRFKVFSDVKAQIRGEKARRQRFFIPPSAEDFLGLLYATLGKGKQGENHLKFYEDNLLTPYSRAMENLSTDRVNLMSDFKDLKNKLDVPKDLKKTTKSGFTHEQAVRVYLWNTTGKEIPGLSKADFKELNDIVEKNFRLKSFADQILSITKGDGYSTPKKEWSVGTITTDLIDILNTTKRSKYLEPWKQNVDVIFSKENLNKLEAVYGEKYREAMENMLTRMKSGSNRTAGGNKLSNQVLDYINNSTGAIMFFNTRSAVLQTISAANFINWSFNNPYRAGKAFANQPQYWKDFTELMNSDYLKDRRQGLKLNISESEISNAAKTSKNKAKAVLNYILEKGYLPTKFADSFAIASGGATFYRNRIIDLMKNEGKTEVEAKKIAMEEFRKNAEISQQSSNPSKISQQQSSDLGRVVLQFVNTPMQYARIQKRAIQDIANGRGDMKTNAGKVAYYMFLQNMIFNALQQGLFALGFGDDKIDDKEEEKLYEGLNGMLDSSLRGLGMAGVTASVLKNLGLDIYDRSKRGRPEYSDAWIKLLEFSPAIKSKLGKLKSAAWPFDSKKRRAEVFEKGFSLDNPAYESMAKVITATTNLPVDRLFSKINNLKNAFADEAEAWQSVAMVLGWPEWQLKTTKQEVAEEKKELKEDPSGYNAWQQKSILKQYGYNEKEIKKLKNEESRVKEILKSQKENNNQYIPLKIDKPWDVKMKEEGATKEEIKKKREEKKGGYKSTKGGFKDSSFKTTTFK